MKHYRKEKHINSQKISDVKEIQSTSTLSFDLARNHISAFEMSNEPSRDLDIWSHTAAQNIKSN